MNRTPHILIAEDEAAFREAAAEILRDAGWEIETCGDGAAAWDAFRKSLHDVVITDIRMPKMDGIALLEKIHDLVPSLPVIMITAHGSIETSVEAMRRGAVDYILKPCNLDELRMRIERVLSVSRLTRQTEALARDTREGEFPGLLGESAAMKDVQKLVEKVARTASTVLITGESGTGKELVAREIHRRSIAGKPGEGSFVPVNCGAIPENLLESELFGHRKGSFTGAIAHKDGLFRVAENGTLFLDEIGELPLSMQVKLLRALDTGEVLPVGAPGPIRCEPRIVAATNRNLEDEVKAGRFREDLFYRVHVFEVRMPPLRERREDIPVLARHFVNRYATRSRRPIHGIRADALRAMMAGPWKGNVRELENVIERAVILCEGEEITMDDLPGSMPDPGETAESGSLRSAVSQFERDHILRVIEQCEGDKKAAAEKLGIGLSSLYRKLEGEEEAVKS